MPSPFQCVHADAPTPTHGLNARQLSVLDDAASALAELARNTGVDLVSLEARADGRLELRGERNGFLKWRLLADQLLGSDLLRLSGAVRVASFPAPR